MSSLDIGRIMQFATAKKQKETDGLPAGTGGDPVGGDPVPGGVAEVGVGIGWLP